MNKIYTREDFFDIIKRFNKVMPAEMSDKWVDKLYEFYILNPEKFLDVSNRMIDKYEYSVIMKNPALIIPYGIYMTMLQKIDECYVFLVRKNKVNKINKYKKRKQERMEYEYKQKQTRKLDQDAKTIGELYK